MCLINATGTGTEILKSLVLPGVGAFTVVDGNKVTEKDTGCKLVKSFVRISDSISHRHNVNMFSFIHLLCIQFIHTWSVQPIGY